MDLLLNAVRNNAFWCDHVVRKAGNATVFTPLYWYTAQPVSEFYPNLITLKQNLNKKEQEEVNKIITSIPLKDFSIKDSFSELEIKKTDYSELFTASWISFENNTFEDVNLSDWQIEKDDQDDDIAYSVKLIDKKPISGFITNIADNVIGVTNVFHDKTDKDFWKECVSLIEENISSFPIVGYEKGKELELAKQSGFKELGKLRVLSIKRG